MGEYGLSRKRKIRKNPMRIIFRGVLAVLLVINITVIVTDGVMGQDSVGNLPYSLIPILSDSMSPRIKSGDAVLVKQEDYEDIEPGDIVVYARDGDLIVHEVIEKDSDRFIAKGAGNAMEDLPVDRGAYKAKYVLRVPLMGGIWRISGNPVKFVLLAVLIGLMIFGDQIFPAVYMRMFDRDNAVDSGKNNTMDKE